ncbi:unnamed protein product [Blepharisma stoltei]|uniref:MORN repeat-containing protein n=1 Tax=Blepharisma stoltei TaxID=1481888 RepID=A0AAU9IP11_9CILI|nr:unnamed protein product [Blepharisma stoltei]
MHLGEWAEGKMNGSGCMEYAAGDHIFHGQYAAGNHIYEGNWLLTNRKVLALKNCQMGQSSEETTRKIRIPWWELLRRRVRE